MNRHLEDLQDIYKNYLKPYEKLDDTYRNRLNKIYSSRASAGDKWANFWDGFASVADSFVTAFAIAVVTAFIAAITPAWLAVAVLLGAGIAVMANIPEESVPDWLKPVKKGADGIADKAVKMLKEGPVSVVEDIGQGLMDEIQTPEGIASVAGGTVGTLSGGYAGSRVNSALKADMEYSPINEGPLKEKIAKNFNGATYTKKILTEDTVMYRVHGGKAGKVGSYMSRTPQGGGLQSQLDLALNPSWGNTTEHVSKVVVPKGTKIYEGVAAPQNILDSRGNIIGVLPGGGNQIYIPKVEKSKTH